MTEVTLAIDVLCEWLGYEPSYRVYVDGDLLTERTYLWDNQQQYVREHLLVDIEPGAHSLVIEPVKVPGSQAVFKTANFTVNDQPTHLINNTFTI